MGEDEYLKSRYFDFTRPQGRYPSGGNAMDRDRKTSEILGCSGSYSTWLGCNIRGERRMEEHVKLKSSVGNRLLKEGSGLQTKESWGTIERILNQ